MWPAHGPGRAGGDLPFPGAGVAEAGDEWCDVDPVLLVVTPKGNLTTVFYLTGVLGPRDLVGALLGLITASYTVQSDGDGTRVRLTVTVPRGLLGLGAGPARPTRLKVTSGLLGSGVQYGSTTGETGKPMSLDFRLGVP
jgi:hypothetical protein